MKDENFVRTIVWGIVFVIVLGLGIIGTYNFYNGVGEKGKLRNELLPYINTFNNSNKVKNYSTNDKINLKAYVSGVNLILSYKTDIKDEKLIFTYEKLENSNIILTTTYSTNISNIADTLLKELIDAVSVVNGNKENELFVAYSYADLQNTSLDKGLRFDRKSNSVEFKINLNLNTLAILGGRSIIASDEKYITLADLETLKTVLEEKNSFNREKNGILLYVSNASDGYDIIIGNSNQEEDEIMIDSLTNAIDVLSSSTLTIIVQDNVDFTKDCEGINYKIIANYEITEDLDIFNDKTHIIYVHITK